MPLINPYLEKRDLIKIAVQYVVGWLLMKLAKNPRNVLDLLYTHAHRFNWSWTLSECCISTKIKWVIWYSYKTRFQSPVPINKFSVLLVNPYTSDWGWIHDIYTLSGLKTLALVQILISEFCWHNFLNTETRGSING